MTLPAVADTCRIRDGRIRDGRFRDGRIRDVQGPDATAE